MAYTGKRGVVRAYCDNPRVCGNHTCGGSSPLRTKTAAGRRVLIMEPPATEMRSIKTELPMGSPGGSWSDKVKDRDPGSNLHDTSGAVAP
jgi:hypothetical protein